VYTSIFMHKLIFFLIIFYYITPPSLSPAPPLSLYPPLSLSLSPSLSLSLYIYIYIFICVHIYIYIYNFQSSYGHGRIPRIWRVNHRGVSVISISCRYRYMVHGAWCMWDVIHHRSNPAGGEGQGKTREVLRPGPGDQGGASAHCTRAQGAPQGLGWATGACHRSIFVPGPSCTSACECHAQHGGEETAGSAAHSAASMQRGFIRLYGHPPRSQPPWDTPGPY
jgi:hypothetical protein